MGPGASTVGAGTRSRCLSTARRRRGVRRRPTGTGADDDAADDDDDDARPTAQVLDARVETRFGNTLAAIRAAGPDAFFNAKLSILHPGTARRPGSRLLLRDAVVRGLALGRTSRAAAQVVLPHCGPSNARLRAHVPLLVDPNATLRVAAEPRVAWAEGRALVFDDSHEHDVRHAGAAPRVVLILDAWHPELPVERRRFELYGMLG